MVLRFSSCQAGIAEPFCVELVNFISAEFGLPCEFVNDLSWQERERLLLLGEILCGLAYVRESNRQDKLIELLVAPVRQHWLALRLQYSAVSPCDARIRPELLPPYCGIRFTSQLASDDSAALD